MVRLEGLDGRVFADHAFRCVKARTQGRPRRTRSMVCALELCAYLNHELASVRRDPNRSNRWARRFRSCGGACLAAHEWSLR